MFRRVLRGVRGRSDNPLWDIKTCSSRSIESKVDVLTGVSRRVGVVFSEMNCDNINCNNVSKGI